MPLDAGHTGGVPRAAVVVPPATAFKYGNLAYRLLGEVVSR